MIIAKVAIALERKKFFRAIRIASLVLKTSLEIMSNQSLYHRKYGGSQ